MLDRAVYQSKWHRGHSGGDGGDSKLFRWCWYDSDAAEHSNETEHMVYGQLGYDTSPEIEAELDRSVDVVQNSQGTMVCQVEWREAERWWWWCDDGCMLDVNSQCRIYVWWCLCVCVVMFVQVHVAVLGIGDLSQIVWRSVEKNYCNEESTKQE